jgi:hypothetical protein
MRHPRLAALSALAAGLMLLTAGCGGGSGGGAEHQSEKTVAHPTHTEPKYSTFDQFPGPELKHVVELGGRLGIRVKAVDSMWTPEFAGKSAEAGQHYLVVYVAAVPEEKDRGTQHVSLASLALRVSHHTGDCGQMEATTQCVRTAFPYSQLAQVADNQWRSYAWEYNELDYQDLTMGVTMIGAVAFPLPDDVNGTYKICGRADKLDMYGTDWPCVAMPQPKNGSTR